jgi:hypothetical protein
MICIKAEVVCGLVMVMYIMVYSIKTKEVVMVYLLLVMITNMKESGNMIKLMDMVFCLVKVFLNMLDSLRIIKKKECAFINQEKFMQESGLMVNNRINKELYYQMKKY